MKFYKHNLQLIERTKLLEGIPCQSIAFTNTIARKYGKGDLRAPVSALSYFSHLEKSPNLPDSYDEKIESLLEYIYVTPVQSGKGQKVETASSLGEQITTYLNQIFGAGYFNSSSAESSLLYIADDVSGYITGISAKELNCGRQLSLQYVVALRSEIENTSYLDKYEIHYIIAGVENRYPTKPNTVTYGINRILDLAEPLFEGQAPRFALNPIQAKKWENTPLPKQH